MAETAIQKNDRSMQAVSELDVHLWSVISFERCEAAGLTYPEATLKLAELERQKISGLCIVTDEAASHVKT